MPGDTGFSVESLCALEDKYDWISAAVKETALVSSVIDEETGSTVNLNWKYEKGVLEEGTEHLSLTLYFCDSNSMLTYTARFRCLKRKAKPSKYAALMPTTVPEMPG